MEFKSASIVISGLCNGDPYAQCLLGILVFRKDESGKFEPRLIDLSLRDEVGSAKDPYKPKWCWKMNGAYGLAFPEFARGHGVMISLDRHRGTYDFVTGIHHGSSGSSGPLTHSGPELVKALDMLCGFTQGI